MSRILLIASHAPSLRFFRGDLIELLRDLRHEVHAASPDPDQETLDFLAGVAAAHHRYRLQRTGLDPRADLATFLDLRALLRRVRPDHVLGYTIKPVIYGGLAARVTGVPHRHAMITGLGTAFIGRGPAQRALNFIARRMYRAALKGCESVMFQNPDDREVFVAGGLVDPRQAALISGSGVNLARFAAAPLPAGGPVFLLIARLTAEKGVRVFADAARRLTARPQARCQIAGPFEDRPGAVTRREMEAWQSEGVIEYLGPLADVRQALRACTVYCLPSDREGTPRTVLEAMATGRAIITTDVPGCRETVRPHENGLLVPVRDPRALAHAMTSFVDDDAMVRSMGLRSREIVAERFDVHQVNRDIVRALGLAGAADGPPTQSPP